MGAKHQRQPGEKLVDFRARCAAAEQEARLGRTDPDRLYLARGTRRKPRRTAEDRTADRIDGYDRDDMGESPDF